MEPKLIDHVDGVRKFRLVSLLVIFTCKIDGNSEHDVEVGRCDEMNPAPYINFSQLVSFGQVTLKQHISA